MKSLIYIPLPEILYEESQPSIPDVLDENINFLFKYQFRYLMSGVTLAFFTFRKCPCRT